MIRDYKVVHRGQPVRKSKKNPLRWVQCAVVISALIVGSIFFVSFYADSKKEVQLMEVIVKGGDTLWSLAQTYDHSNGNNDIRESIYEIKKLNQLTSAQIYPGQVIYIPLMD